MPDREAPVVSDDAPIGPDVDLDQEDVRLPGGTRLTNAVAAEIIEEVTLRSRVGERGTPGDADGDWDVGKGIPAEVRAIAERYGIDVSLLWDDNAQIAWGSYGDEIPLEVKIDAITERAARLADGNPGEAQRQRGA